MKEFSGKDRALLRALGMLRDRRNYYDSVNRDTTNAAFGAAYASAVTILEAALSEDWETLNQYDYYGED